ncbi:MAG: oligogalacturonate lyase family protein, partial [Asticcacaulis sp.]
MMTASRRTALKGFLGSVSALGLTMTSAGTGTTAQAQTAPAQPAPAPKGPIPREWTDPKTGRRIVRLSDEDGSGVLYFYRQAYTPQGDIMVIKSPSGIIAVRLKDWKTSLLIKGKENDLLFMMRTTREAVYAVTDPGTSEAEDRPKTLFAIHVDTKKVRKLGRIASGRITCSNADDTLLLGQVAYGAKPLQPKDAASVEKFGQAEYAAIGPDGKPLNFARAKGVRMWERWSQRVPAELFTLNIATQARTVLYKTEEWIGHAQFSPTDPTLIRFCMEGPWHRVDRIKLIRSDGSDLRSVHTRTMNMEIWGHEFFSQDGKWLWYDLQTPRGQVFWVAGLELATG